MFYVICFDITDDRRLRSVSNTLEDYGQRVQRSVFECHLKDDELAALKARLAELIDPFEDHIRYYALCGKDLPGIVIDGAGEVTQDPDYHLI